MKVSNTNDLSAFMDRLKEWCRIHSYEQLLSAIDSAENTSFTASELIIKYTEVLRRFKDQLPENLPTSFRDSWLDAIEVGQRAVETVEYETKKRSLFSLG